jgi:5-methyltetrahydrofolate--homocysteine methyltransferase
MAGLLERVKTGEILVADGAMGTMLYERGVNIHQCPERVNLTGPEILEEIARLYLEAGADIIQTNTFGASPLKLAKYSYDDRTEEIVGRAVKAVRDVVGDNAYVSGSCGPCARVLKPYGDTEPDEVYESFVRQMKAFAQAGVDVVCIETMTDISEAVLAVKAAKTISSATPVMATMTFDSTPRGFYTIMGVDVKTAAAELEKAGADLVGSNCGNGIEKMVEIAQGFRLCSRLPIIIQSNAGLPVMVKGRPVYRETPEFMADKAEGLISSGVSIIGGCCGTTPAHIAAIREVVDYHSGR